MVVYTKEANGNYCVSYDIISTCYPYEQAGPKAKSILLWLGSELEIPISYGTAITHIPLYSTNS